MSHKFSETALVVTFRRLGRSKQTWQMVFDCGDDNGRMMLREAWNTNSEIIEVASLDS